MIKSFKAIPIIIMIALAAAACSRGRGKVIAEVEGVGITSEDLRQGMLMDRLVYDPAVLTTEANFDEFRRRSLQRLIQEAIMLKEAERQGISGQVDTPLPVEEAALEDRGIDPKAWQEAQRRRAMIRGLIQREVVAKIPVAEGDIKAYYRKHIQDFRDNTQFHARQILVDSKELADQIHARLMKGEKFASLAKEFSVSPDGERGGDLGFFDAASYPEVFSEVCQKLKPGEISEVVATPYGFQIFQLLERRPARQRQLDEVADAIRLRLGEEKIEEAYRPWLEGLMDGATVMINEEAVKEVRLNG